MDVNVYDMGGKKRVISVLNDTSTGGAVDLIIVLELKR